MGGNIPSWVGKELLSLSLRKGRGGHSIEIHLYSRRTQPGLENTISFKTAVCFQNATQRGSARRGWEVVLLLLCCCCSVWRRNVTSVMELNWSVGFTDIVTSLTATSFSRTTHPTCLHSNFHRLHGYSRSCSSYLKSAQ